ncbi:MAG: MBL fold metallo-hydrolase [Muribaculaceae bacterium]
MVKRNNNTPNKQIILFDTFDEEDVNELIATNKSKETLSPQSEDIISEVGNIQSHKAFRFISFGSGSSGNCSYVGSNDCGVLIDAGVDVEQVFKSLANNGINPESIKGICLTHDHGDHIRYAYTIVRKYRHIHIYCTNRVMNGILRRHNISRRIKDQHVPIFKEIPFELAGLNITAFEVPHDGSDNSGFFIEYADKRFAIATDIGHVAERAFHYMTQPNYLMIEANYDAEMLSQGTYPEYLKNRILAANGHLDNKDAARFIADNYKPELKYIFLCHLSNDNNTPEIARDEIITALSEKGITVGTGEETLEDQTKSVQLIALPRYESSRWFVLR